MTAPDIAPRLLDEITLNAWPARHTVLYDGWVLRLSDGFTRRANSVAPLYPGTEDVSAKIAFCEQFYRRRQQPPIFRLPPFAQPSDLDARLAQRGYRRVDETSVQAADLSWSGAVMARGAAMLPGWSGVEMWLGHFERLSADNPARRDSPAHLRLLRAVTGTLCPMTLTVRNEVVACGLGVLDGRFFGVFNVVVAREQRGKGYGHAVTESLLAWGIEMRADVAYLQVGIDNEPAQRLYAGLGFVEAYRYGYRVGA